MKTGLLEFLIDARRAGRRVAAYGAPAKGNTLLSYCGVGPELVEYTVDRSPAKQGRLLPGSRIPVHAPERLRAERPDDILILPWNLRDEIAAQLHDLVALGSRPRGGGAAARGGGGGVEAARDVRETGIAGVVVGSFEPVRDERGAFERMWDGAALAEHGIDPARDAVQPGAQRPRRHAARPALAGRARAARRRSSAACAARSSTSPPTSAPARRRSAAGSGCACTPTATRC